MTLLSYLIDVLTNLPSPLLTRYWNELQKIQNSIHFEYFYNFWQIIEIFKVDTTVPVCKNFVFFVAHSSNELEGGRANSLKHPTQDRAK